MVDWNIFIPGSSGCFIQKMQKTEAEKRKSHLGRISDLGAEK
jgi:hypothetical protein